MSDSEDEEQTIATDLVVTKYKMAAEIANGVLSKLVQKCEPGESVLQLCSFGDNLLIEETNKVFKKEKELKKGIAFPTCISVNNCVCHFSPLKSDPDAILSDSDLVKIDLGAHIDGFIALAAHTFVIGASKENKVTGKKADVILAAHYAAELALRLTKPGNENFLVTSEVQAIAEEYHCKPVEGMLSYQLRRHVIDGEKSILLNPNEQMRVDYEKQEFAVHEVYGVDILVSSADGKVKEHDTRTTVHKRNDVTYQLKMKTSRQFFSDVGKQYDFMPFTLRAFDDERKAKMGVIECVKHELMKPFPVLFEKEGEFVAQFKFTVLLMPNGPMKITGLPIDLECFESENSVKDEKLKAILAQSTSRKAAKKKKKKQAEKMISNMEQHEEDVVHVVNT